MVPFNRSSFGFPLKLKTSHRYSQSAQIASGAGTATFQLFRCNGMFDPDATGGGHQPMYFDQLGAIYDHYTVFRSRITWEFLVDKPANVVLYIDDDASVASTINQAAEQPSAIYQLCSSTGVKPFRLVRSWDAKKYFGGDIFDNDNLQGTPTTDPSELSFFTFIAQACDLASVVTISYRVVIDYDVVWDELKTQTAS